MKRTTIFVLTCVLSFPALPAAANEVLLAGSPQYPTAQAAVDAASDGDIIRFGLGAQGEVVIDGKALTLLGSSGFNAPHFTAVRIRNLAPSQSVLLRDIHVGFISNLDYRLCEITDCDGPVFLEDSEMCLDVRNAAKVVATRCQLRGPSTSSFPDDDPAPALPALRVEDSFVAVYDGQLVGASGVPAGFLPFQTITAPSTPGAPGLLCVSGTAYVAGATVRGGRGGSAFFGFTCLPSSPSAPGALVQDGTLIALDTTFVPALPPIEAPPCPPTGVQPPPVELGPNATMQTKNDVLRGLTVSTPAMTSGPMTFELAGQPGEIALLLFSDQPNGNPALQLKGALVTAGVPPVTIVLGAIPGDGTLEFTATMPAALPHGFEGVVLYFQAAVAGASGTGLLTSPSFAVILTP